MAEHRYAEAAAEFSEDPRSSRACGLDPIGALAHLQLGRVPGQSTRRCNDWGARLRLGPVAAEAAADPGHLQKQRASVHRSQ